MAAAGRMRGWLLLGIGIGLGVLSKGPVILLHTLPVALLAPLWLNRVSMGSDSIDTTGSTRSNSTESIEKLAALVSRCTGRVAAGRHNRLELGIARRQRRG